MLKKADKQSSLAEDGRAANRGGWVEVVRWGLGLGVRSGFGKRGERKALSKSLTVASSLPSSQPGSLHHAAPSSIWGLFPPNIPQCSATPHLAPLFLSRFQIDYIAPGVVTVGEEAKVRG